MIDQLLIPQGNGQTFTWPCCAWGSSTEVNEMLWSHSRLRRGRDRMAAGT